MIRAFALLLVLSTGTLGEYTLLFTQNHEEGYDIWGTDYTGFLEFSRLLEDEGFTITALNQGTLTPDVLEGVDAAIVSYPEVMFEDAEREALKDYVEGGGSLVVFGGYDTINQTNPIIQTFGIEITSSIVDINGSRHFNLGVPEDIPHPIFTDVEIFEQVNTPTIKLVEPPGNVYYPVLETENEGLFVIKDVGEGMVVVTGDADFVNNLFLPNYDNAQLGVNIVSYATGRTIEKIGPLEEKDGGPAAALIAVGILLLLLAGGFVLRKRTG